MLAREFWALVTSDRSAFLDRLVSWLAEERIAYCVIGGQGVNAYVEPLVSLDLDLAVAARHLSDLEARIPPDLTVARFPHSLNVAAPGSDLRVQFQTDERYSAFVDRAVEREVLGVALPVARVEDVLQGKIWAALEPGRRPSKRRKDLLDIERLIETYPELRSLVPPEILDRLGRM
jgi:nucleotidyltransferase AbiEii toxin of type IV toxin-antitoxin system